ncbi:MAG: protein-glutamate methylesterase/protein-glutamine glutaminase [Hyphomicrobiaceae bacterium]
MKPIRVLVVDESTVLRQYLTDVLSSDVHIDVVGTAPSAMIARQMIKRLNPDVLTLDSEMPDMNGLEFLGHLMRLRPMPVIMFSSLRNDGSKAALRALEIGAFDFVHKPYAEIEETWTSVAETLIARIKAAASVSVGSLTSRSHQKSAAPDAPVRPWPRNRIVAIGSSAGGVQALREVFKDLPLDSPPIMVAQHMPAAFTRGFAARLNENCKVGVHEAKDGQPVRPGNIYIAPGNYHLLIEKRSNSFYCRLEENDGNKFAHIPSVDYLFQSFARVVGRPAMGLVLTGMGKDGASGLRSMREAGGITAAQDRESSLIYGMPKAAMEHGAAQFEISLERVPSFILERQESVDRLPHEFDGVA